MFINLIAVEILFAPFGKKIETQSRAKLNSSRTDAFQKIAGTCIFDNSGEMRFKGINN
jgi:hypothetical protein